MCMSWSYSASTQRFEEYLLALSGFVMSTDLLGIFFWPRYLICDFEPALRKALQTTSPTAKHLEGKLKEKIKKFPYKTTQEHTRPIIQRPVRTLKAKKVYLSMRTITKPERR